MRTFKDKSGQDWSLDLPFGAVLRVKTASAEKFNLLDPTKLANELAIDELLFWELLWHLVAPEAAERKIDAGRFGELMAADCLFEARRQFYAEWSDFFQLLHRPDRAAVVEKIGSYLAKAIELTTAKLASPEMKTLDDQVEAKMRQTLNDSFGELAASLGSTPASSPGGS